MSGKSPVRVYWDTCILLTLLNPRSTDTFAADVKTIHGDAEAGKIQIVSSEILRTEAFHLGNFSEKDAKALEGDLAKINGFLSHGYIQMVELNRTISIRTQHLRQSHNEHLDFEDAIHIATALELDIEFFLTIDGIHREKNREKRDRKSLLSLNGQFRTKTGATLRILTPGKYLDIRNPLPLVDHGRSMESPANKADPSQSPQA